MIYQFNEGSIIETKKTHVCGSNQWKVIRFGVDCKIECLKCKRIVMMHKRDLDKKIKKIVNTE